MLAAVLLLGGSLPDLPSCDAGFDPEPRPCHARSGSPSDRVVADGAGEDTGDGCCTTDCRDCTLPCCARTAVILTHLSGLGGPGPAKSVPLPLGVPYFPLVPDPLDHPPQA